MKEIFDANPSTRETESVHTFPIDDLERNPRPKDFIASPQEKRELKHDLPGRDPLEYSEVLRTTPRSRHSFDSFAPLPKHTKSTVLLDDERIVLLLRKHWMTLLPAVLLTLFFLIAPFFLSDMPFFNDRLAGANKFFFWAFWNLCGAGILLQATVIWFFNVYILTDERVIDVNFNSILSSDISTAKIESIQDHSIKTNGFLGTMFDYGNVEIQTAGEQNEFSFKHVPFPEKTNKLLGEMMLEEERERMEGRVS